MIILPLYHHLLVLSAEYAIVLWVLRNLHFFNYLTNGSAVTCTILSCNSNFLRSLAHCCSDSSCSTGELLYFEGRKEGRKEGKKGKRRRKENWWVMSEAIQGLCNYIPLCTPQFVPLHECTFETALSDCKNIYIIVYSTDAATICLRRPASPQTYQLTLPCCSPLAT